MPKHNDEGRKKKWERNDARKGMLTTTTSPVIRKHVEEKKKSSKKRNIDEEYSSSTKRNRKKLKRNDVGKGINMLRNNSGKGILTSTSPVMRKHVEEEEENKSSTNSKKRNIDEENSSKRNDVGNDMLTTTTSPMMAKHVEEEKSSTTNVDEENLKRNDVGKGMLTTTTSPLMPKHVEEKEWKMNDLVKGILEKSNKKKSNDEERNDLVNGKSQVEDQHITTSNIKIGDTLNLSDLLFTNERNYLINYKKNKRVKAKDLAGKVIVLHFMSLVHLFSEVITHLLDIYSKLQPRGDFEIVFVAHSDSHDISPHCTKELSRMPWPAIPLSDLKSRERLEKIFGVSRDDFMPPSFIIDPIGVVLQCHATPLFIRYGAAGYPFTNERIEFLDSEDNVVQMQPVSIEKLLASPQCDYLINNKGDQVPLHNLDDKVVGLYFCPYLHQSYPTEELEMVYKELLEKREDFEIVLVYTHGWYEDFSGRTDEALFLKAFKSMPWLALPFEETNCNKKLQRIFKYPQDLGGLPPNPRLVIIGPHGKFIEPLGGNILLKYGVPAYPFTTFSTVNLELERVKKLKPEMLWDLDSVFTHNDGSQVLFSQLVGKRIIVIFQNRNIPYKLTVKELIERYFKMKGTDDEFEVIHILGENCLNENRLKKNFAAPVPWLMYPLFDHDSYACQIIDSVFSWQYGLLAFDRDGSVVRRTEVLKFGDSTIFPFYHNGDMYKEVLLEVENRITFRIRGDDDGIGTVYV